jgi:hypothetical protein
MLKLALIVVTLLAIIVLVALIGVLGLWMKDVDVIAFPGLGLLVATKLFLIVLTIAEISLVLIAAYLVRFIPFVRELTDEIGSAGG